MKVLATNIGSKSTLHFKGKKYHTGLVKKPVSWGIDLDIEEVEHDMIVNRKYHGGVDQALYAFGANHYTFFKPNFSHVDWEFGVFGENITLDYLDESRMITGEVYRLGNALIEVTKPRIPCMTLAAYFQDEKILDSFWDYAHCGVYFKILERGHVNPGDLLVKVKDAPQGALTIKEKFLARKS